MISSAANFCVQRLDFTIPLMERVLIACIRHDACKTSCYDCFYIRSQFCSQTYKMLVAKYEFILANKFC